MKLLSLFSLLLISLNSFALVVIKPEYKDDIYLKIIRVVPDGFETYSLHNQNGREMTLVCANNRFYENNKRAFIEYRNFFNEVAGQFILESNIVCKEMAKFIEEAHSAVDEWRPFLITLSKKKMTVEKIIYPKVDSKSDTGNNEDLLPKKKVLDFSRPDIYLN
jgi:hypothetical protein